LIGAVRSVKATASRPRLLGPGLEFHDAWQILLEGERASAVAVLNFGRELPESTLSVIGQDASVELWLDRDLAALHFKTTYADFFEQFLNGARASLALAGQSAAGLVNYALSTVKLRGRTDTFYRGMHDSIAAFHRAVAQGAEPPVSGRDGLAVVELCERTI